MNITPIIILAKDNPKDFILTLMSIRSSEIFNNPIFIVDDQTEDPTMKDLLYSNKNIDLNFKNIDCSRFNSNEISSFCKKFNIVKTQSKLKNYSILFGINLAFTIYPNSKHCVIIESGVIANKNWFIESNKAFINQSNNNQKLGIVSVFNENLNEKTDSIINYEIMVSRDAYITLKEYNYFDSSEIKFSENPYEDIRKILLKMNFYSACTEKNWICLNDKIDDKFIKPFCLKTHF